MAAEVATGPSQTAGSVVGGSSGGGITSHSSGPKSPYQFSSPTSSSSIVHAPSSSQKSLSSPQQQYITQGQSQSPYKPTALQSDDVSNSSYYSSHRLSPSDRSAALPSPAPERSTIPRALPPMMAGTSPANSAAGESGSMAPTDPRLPMSPGGSINISEDRDTLSGDPAAPRKRSKVSRACDECRRKKIRCDASSESGIEQCSSCKRVGSKCSFSRVPMKRGPSKGYIKELADRLNTLENSISTGDLHQYGLSGDGDRSPNPSDSTSPPPAGGPPRGARKRTLSSSSEFQQSGVHLQPLSQTNPTGGRQERLPSIDSFHPVTQHQHQQRSQLLQHESQRQLSHLVGSRPPQPQGPDAPQLRDYNSSIATDGTRHSFWKGSFDRRASISFPYDVDPQLPSTNSTISEVKTFEWDEDSIDQYYSLIHPTFPLLPHSKPRLRQRLAAASITVREALLEALYAAVRSNPSYPPKSGTPQANPRRACELCVASQFENQDPRASAASSLLYLQTLILMALEADNHGPATMRGMSSGPPRAAWVGSAVGLAYSLKLHHNTVGERFTHGDPDSDEKLGRRAWWVLVVLDRWHAISTSSPLFIPDSNVVLLPEDQMLIGLTPFHLVRLSCILGHLAEAFTTADEIVSAASLNPYICRLLRGELERFRESVEVVWGSLSLLHVAYYHVKLLTLRHNSSSEPRQLLEPALRMATMLDHSSMPITPLNHHFAALALITLVDLAEIDETRDEAWRGIQQLDEALKKRRGLATREDSVGWDRAIKDLISTRVESRYTNLGPGTPQGGTGSLQHLAELAIGEQNHGMQRKRRGLDAGNLQKYGYLGSILL